MPSTKEVFEQIQQSLTANPARTGGIQAVYQFNLSGDDPGVYQIILRPDEAMVVEGEPEKPDCTLELTADDFKDLVAGKLNGTIAFMTRQLRVKGDVGLAIKLQSLLGAYSG
jgi:putative sterol carrier protein